MRPTALIGVPALWEAVHRRIVDEVEERGPFFHAAFDQLRELNRRLDRDSGINLGSVLFRQAHTRSADGCGLRSAAAPRCRSASRDFFNDLGIRLLEGYGLTEAAPVLSTAHPDDPHAPDRSASRSAASKSGCIPTARRLVRSLRAART